MSRYRSHLLYVCSDRGSYLQPQVVGSYELSMRTMCLSRLYNSCIIRICDLTLHQSSYRLMYVKHVDLLRSWELGVKWRNLARAPDNPAVLSLFHLLQHTVVLQILYMAVGS